WAWLSLRADMSEAEQRSARLARVIQEHASKVFEGNHQINSRIRDATAGWSNAQLRQHEDDIHTRLADIVGGLPQASSLAVYDEQG
ncbi:hypothetical protein OH413_26055, partial [Salmonella enterica]|nr:hypothetical protein [Salmonella enterica]